MNKYTGLLQMAIDGNMDAMHMALIHEIKVPCAMMGTATNGHYNVNIRYHIIKNLAGLSTGNFDSKAWH